MEEKLFHVDTWIGLKIHPNQMLLETILHELSSLAMISLNTSLFKQAGDTT